MKAQRLKLRGGLESGASGVKLVLLTCRKSDIVVEKALINEESFELRIKGLSRPALEIVHQLLTSCSLSGHKMVLVADEATESCFVIIPKMNEANEAGAMLLQAKKLLSWAGEKPIMARVDSKFLHDRTGSVVSLADWNALIPWCRLIERSGGVMDDITARACAYQALANRQGWAEEFPVFLVADFGALSSCFYILDSQTVRLLREISIGGDDITKALTTEVSADDGVIRLSDSEAEAFKVSGVLLSQTGKNASDTAGGQASQGAGQIDIGRTNVRALDCIGVMVRPVAERMSSEVMRSIKFFQENTGKKVDAVFITGGAISLQPVQTCLKEVISLPVRVIDPFAGLNFSDVKVKEYAEKHKGRFAVAVGLALSEQRSISLLPRSVQFSKRLAEFASHAVAVLLIMGFFPLLFIGIFQTNRAQSGRAEMEVYKKELAEVSKHQQQLEALQANVKKALDRYHALESLVVRAPIWPGILNALAEAVPADIVLTHCSTEDESSAFILRGQVLPSATGFDDAIAVFLSALSSSVFFQNVRVTDADAGRSDETLGDFKIQCEIVY